MRSVQRPVLLTGFDLETQCRSCGAVQVVSDGEATPSAGDEFVALHGFPGRYVLQYRLICWTCGNLISGSLTIRSRSAPSA